MKSAFSTLLVAASLSLFAQNPSIVVAKMEKYPVPRKTYELDSKSLKETSGLVHDGKVLWSHQDNSGTNSVHSIDPNSGKNIDEVEIKNNQSDADWEAMAQDGQYIYLGDVGQGTDESKIIYRLPKNSMKDKIEVEFFEFEFAKPDEVYRGEDEIYKLYDCEAMFVDDGQIYLMTKYWGIEKGTPSNYCKNWHKDAVSRVYTIDPNSKGEENEAKLVACLKKLGGKVTGADIRPDGQVLAVVGYGHCCEMYLWLFTKGKDGSFFSMDADIRQVLLGYQDVIGQVEAVAFDKNNPDIIYFSAEESDFLKCVTKDPFLHKLDISYYLRK